MAVAVLTPWYKFVVLKGTEGKCFLAVYADDSIAGFQHKTDAERYYAELKERLGSFLHFTQRYLCKALNR